MNKYEVGQRLQVICESVDENGKAKFRVIAEALSTEEKVDAWHNGTRRENYKACSIDKLNAFKEIAQRKGYQDIIDIIDQELARRGVQAEEPQTNEEPQMQEPENAEPEVVNIPDSEIKKVIAEKAFKLGKEYIYGRSIWNTFRGHIGSYHTDWSNANGNSLSNTAASNKLDAMRYDNENLYSLQIYFRGGYFDGISLKSSTEYTLDIKNYLSVNGQEECTLTFNKLSKTQRNLNALVVAVQEELPQISKDKILDLAQN